MFVMEVKLNEIKNNIQSYTQWSTEIRDDNDRNLLIYAIMVVRDDLISVNEWSKDYFDVYFHAPLTIDISLSQLIEDYNYLVYSAFSTNHFRRQLVQLFL